MREELKPCPFCGGEADFQQGIHLGFAHFKDMVNVKCGKCDRSEGFVFKSKTAASRSWNTRPEAAQVRVNGLPCPDTLAQTIRKVDGSNSLGAGELAERILSALEQPNTVAQPDGWRDISTAPKDGTVVFVWHETEINRHAAFDVKIKKGQWIVEANEWRVEGVGGNVPPNLTHWMPLPPAPEKER